MANANDNESRLISGARELVAHEILVVDGDPKVQKGLVQILSPAGLHVTAAPDHETALELIDKKFFGVVVIDLDTPTPGAGIELVKKVHTASPTTILIVLSPRKSFDGAVLAFREGARDVIMKAPDQVEYLKTRILAAAGDAVTRGKTGSLLVDVRERMDEFLKTLMEAERRALDMEDKAAGRDTSRSDLDDEMRILVVDADDRLFQALVKIATPGFGYTLAQSGGEALDRVTNSRFHITLVGETLPDMPGSMIVRALKAQAPDLIVISYVPNGRLEIVEQSKTIPIVDKFTAATQLTERLGELAEAHRAKGRERRYIAAFRERHYEYLRRFAELRRRIDRAIEDG